MSSLPEKNASNVSTFVPLQKSTSRTRLNLLNPMNLLARRRSAQATERSAPAAKATSSTHRTTVGYEGIRGTKVHDFSAPRPKPQPQISSPPQLQNPFSSNGGGSRDNEGERSATTTSAHTPVFKEDFDDGQSQFPAAGPHVRKPSDFSDLRVPMPAYAKNKELPAKPASLEPETGTLAQPAPIPPTASSKPPPTPPRDKVAKRPGLEERTLSYDADTKEEVDRIPIQNLEIGSKKTPLAGVVAQDGRLRNGSNASAKSIVGNMKHMKSNSSRFSFDMIGAATQEKLLEDRHREKAAENKSQVPAQNDGYDEDDEDNFDYDDMEDDGLEEKIPGVNADFEEGDEYDNEGKIPGVNADFEEEDEDEDTYQESPKHRNLDSFTFHPMNTSTLTSPISSQGPPQPPPPPETPEDPVEDYSEQVRISLEQDFEEEEATQRRQDPPVKPQWLPDAQSDYGISHQKPYANTDDDMYFDDGTFGFDDDDEEPIPMAGGGDFDESVFDNNDTDEYGRPIRTFDSSIPTTNYSPPGLTSDEASRRESAEQLEKANKEMETFAEGMSAFGLAGNLQPQSSVNHGAGLQPTLSLTQDTLNAHLQALAAHTQAALSNGRFRRGSEEGQGQFMPNTDNALADDFEDGVEDDFDYNDEFDEDELIASANAEALAHDSGFYAQEFGFYSQPAPASGDEAVYSNGGYFGPSGAGAITINRSKSGRVLEPNLTPITERSEYSNRNSIMSLPQLASQHGGSMVGSPSGMNGGLGSNMGLAQIAGMLREEDEQENKSIGALLRLRNKKWGGSQNSLSLGGQTPNDNRLSTGSPLLAPGQGGGFSVGLGREDGASSPQWTHTPWQQSQTFSSSPEMTKLEIQREAYGRQAYQPKHDRNGSAFSLHSETDGISPVATGISPTLTFSPPPDERPAMHQQHSSNSVNSYNYFTHPVRPSPHLQDSSKTITQSQQNIQTLHTLPSPDDLKSDIPPPPKSLRHSLELRPTSSSNNLTAAIGLVSPSAQQFDAEVGFFSKKGKEINPEFRKHRHTGSAESVSYMKEDEPDGQERWVLERRRTAESGEFEVEREVVRGGRI